MLPEQRKLYRILKLIFLLKLPGGKTIHSLSEDLEISERTVYRYLKLLESTGFPVDCKVNSDRWFLAGDEAGEGAGFLLEEATLLRDLVIGGAHHHPLKDGILQKLYIHSELRPLAKNLVNARVNILLDKLVKAINQEKQVILKNYHSANSGEVKDYKVEPFDFTENYATVLAFDTTDQLNKQFKLERMGEVIPLDTHYKNRKDHEKRPTDMFGCTGPEPIPVSLRMTLRAYLLMREEYPRSIPYLSKDEETGDYLFNGPVYSFDGIGRFVMGLLSELKDIESRDLKNLIKSHISLADFSDTK
jgi:proteasome accessory factor C